MDYERVAEHIVSWLNEYLTNSGLEGFVIGVSGGIDSAVTSTLAAMTGRPVIVLNMPIHQAADQLSRSDEHIEWLMARFDNVTAHTVDLTATYDSYVESLPEVARSGLADANSASRIRMMTLYSFATPNRSLVVGTGNRVEDHGIGFFTKYGDGGVDLSPIADLTKTEVYFLASFLEVPDSIMGAIPTDGLWGDNRSDEEQIGATYAELEKAMAVHDAGFFDYDSLTEREREVMEIYEARHNASRHKLEAPPICLIPSGVKYALSAEERAVKLEKEEKKLLRKYRILG